MARRRPFASLTSRLVLTAVLLVVAVSLLIGAAATLAMQNRLTDQVDDQVRRPRARSADGRSTPATSSPTR